MSLRKSATSGLVWTFLDTVVARGVGIAASVLLARLLSPREFGLMGMVYIFTAVSATLVDGGLTASLIRTQQVDNRDYSTIFFTNIAVSFILYWVVFLLAPFIAAFYDEPDLIFIVRVYALIFVITSFSAVQLTIFQKKMDFKKLMLLNIPGILIGAGIGITMAYYGFGVWSIIAMQLATQAVLTIMLWIVSDWKPSFVFSTLKLKRHFEFGYKLTLSGLLNTIFDNIYNVLIGRFYATASLGHFERAKTFSLYPATILTTMVGKVSYPLMAGIQDEKERLASAYKQILQFIFFISAPLMLGLSAVGKPLILFVLGPQWEQAAVFFQILCISGMLYPIHAFNLNLLKVYGRSDWFLKVEVIKKIMIAVVVAIAFQFGIYALVWSAAIISVLALAINTYYTNLLINYNLWQQFRDVWVILLLGIVMFLIMYAGQYYFFDENLFLKILVPSITGALFYAVTNYFLKTPSLQLLLQFKQNLK
ncbi:lipopolysaccharide biosynthesis protein [Aequorivita echinoideorum]|uniref:Lipopolysaccharide biosynthesis protein n=1 Tax=Aequorivita echinoideorum TaxID=1549647 RepID=A0ABS5S4N7_9FLAO|nr:lipopolysaccharide biosynthesis protein [Aequorivita echinoideorum]MBT0607938.1 lipopolysaccharide biosynthesis protein [Aequorivita echinoideorum]